jgi:hypothetical protein
MNIYSIQDNELIFINMGGENVCQEMDMEEVERMDMVEEKEEECPMVLMMEERRAMVI